MKQIALSFLGTSDYGQTKYRIDGTVYENRFIQKVIREHFEVDYHLIFTTEAAKRKHSQSLMDLGYDAAHLISIPDGRSEEELWQLFEIITEQVPENAKLVFDVTHGFRIQPMLALATLVFLRFHKNVEVKGVYYGLFEKGEGVINEVLDITPFLDLIDWSFAIRRFQEKGDAADLSKILSRIHKASYFNKAGTPSIKLQNFGDRLNKLMKALAVSRPAEVAGHALEINKQYDEVSEDLRNIVQTKPLAILIGDIQKETNKISVRKADLFSGTGLKAQADMLRWYLKTEQYQQAITLCRECLISLIVLDKQGNPLKKEDRKKARDYLYECQNAHKEHKSSQIPALHIRIMQEEHNIGMIRNDLNHAGMREQPMKSPVLVKNIVTYCQDAANIIDEYAEEI